MDNHPIPQDVTGFQFRLIGSLTVKQFAYIGASTIFCIVIWYLPLVHPIIKGILLLLIGGTGPALAFLPIEGRPLDQMAGHFVKALLQPNQYIFHKMGGKLPLSTIELHRIKQLTVKEQEQKKAEKQQIEKKEEKLERYLSQLHTEDSPSPHIPTPSQSVTTGNQLIGIPQQLTNAQQPAQPPVQQGVTPPTQTNITPLPQTPTVLPQTPELSPNEQKQKLDRVEEVVKKETELAQELSAAKQIETNAPTLAQQQLAHQQAATLDQKLQEIMQQKMALEQELHRLKQDMTTTTQAVPAPIPPQPAVQVPPTQSAQEVPEDPSLPGVRNISQGQAQKAGLLPTLPDEPNLIQGIIKDSRGNVLPGILVEVKDADGNPVRAFKTNGLGQFAAATALQNGTYKILFEDLKGQHRFDIVEIEVNGQVIPPIEVISHDAREALRHSLFG